jgi:hypothetical protein
MDFNCPACGGTLEYGSTWVHHLWFAVSLFSGPAFSYYLGYSGVAFILVAAGSATLLFLLGVGVIFRFHPSTVQPKRSFGETCQGYADHISLPPVGSHVRIVGRFVQDTFHGQWNEIHPVTSVTAIP